MLARQSALTHPTAGIIRTPLLVPSFSSKGFGFDPQGRSEVQRIFDVATEFITDTMLVSAYDLAHGHLARLEAAIAELTFVDSGGYETADSFDLSDLYIHDVNPKEWDRNGLVEELRGWPEHVPAVFVSYDRSEERHPLGDQIDAAADLLGAFPGHLNDFLIKPETAGQKYIQIDNVVASVEQLRPFSIIGMTEKELGSSFIDRMTNIGKVRRAMDAAGLRDRPIHVFGSLDPVSVCLYFLAGAEIFDGLTWLRFGYHEEIAIYRHNFAARTIGVHRKDDFVKIKAMQDNLNYLSDLQVRMQRYLASGDLAVFGRNCELLSNACQLLQNNMERAA